MYKAKEIKFTYDSKTLLSKKDDKIKKDIEICKNILSDLQNVINIRKNHEAKHQQWWDDRKKFNDDWMNLIDALNDKLIEKNKLT
jgi:hypothetical protein